MPPLDEQKRIADLLLSIEHHRRAKGQESASVDRVRQSFIDAFLHHAASAYRVERLDALTTKIADGVHQRPSYTEDGIPFLTVENLTRSDGIDFGDVRYVPRSDHEVFIRRAHPERGDVLVSKDGTLGVARVVEREGEFSIFVSIALLKPRSEVLLPQYLRSYFDSGHFKSVLASKTSGSALKHIHLVDFRAMQVPVPPIEAQRAFVAEVDVISNSLKALGEEAAMLHGTKSALLADVFRGAN